ncbi:MAG: YdbH domain-containing protein [Thiohalomonadaceae bacterium]
MRIAWKPLGWGLLAVLVLAVLLSVLAARHLWKATLQQNGIETLEWTGLDLSFSGVSVRQLTLTQSQPAGDVALQARELELAWRWRGWGAGWQPRLTALTAEYVELDWHTKTDEQPESAPSQPNQWPPELPVWLPAKIVIQSFRATLPCETGRCPLTGFLSITSSPIEPSVNSATPSLTNQRLPIQAQLQLDHEGHQLGVLAKLDGSWLDELNFNAELTLDGTRYLSAESYYSQHHKDGLVSWRGSVEMPDLPQTDWLLAWLQSWQSIPTQQWPEQPDTGSAAAHWQLQGANDKTFLAGATGSVNIHAQLPQPWPAPGLGEISGNVEIALKADRGQWQPETLQVDMELSHPAGWITKVPPQLRPDTLVLSIRPAQDLLLSSANSSPGMAGAEQTLLPLNVELNSRGGANIALHSHLAVTTKAPWLVQLGKTQLTAAVPQLEAAGWMLSKPRLQITLTGQLNAARAVLKIDEPTILEVDQLEPLPDTTTETTKETLLKGRRADLSNTGLEARYQLEQGTLDQLSVSGTIGLSAKQIKHPQLLVQSWQFNGKLSSDLAHTDLSGVLKAKSGTAMNVDLSFPYQGLLRLEGKMRVSGENEADALARVLTAWPPLLTISGGNVSANAAYEQPQHGAMRLTGKLVFADWSGTYDRTAWSRMNGIAEFLLENDRISVTTAKLTVEEVNPGLPIGPILVAGGYQAPLAQLTAGLLTLEQVSSGALGGDARIHAGGWDLSQAPVEIPVEINQLSLAQLLQIYPTEGLAGTGILSGTVPLLFDPASGIRVERGRIDALKPGGQLQLPAERLKALASQSESMQQIAQALENFHYSVLDSGIDYDQDGTLILKLRLIGSSPEVGDGQQVVLNITLEENIPALLTTLQLSGRVSDTVTDRVKKILQKREQKSIDLLE